MGKLDIKQLVKELSDAEEYLPENKGKGFNYVYSNLYVPFVNDSAILLLDIDFDAFSLEDLSELSSEYYEENSRRIQFNNDLKNKLEIFGQAAVEVGFI